MLLHQQAPEQPHSEQRPPWYRPWGKRSHSGFSSHTLCSTTAFLHSFFHGFFAGFDGRFDVGPLLRHEALASFNRLIKRRPRFFGCLDQVFLRLSGVRLQLSARLFSGFRREEDSGHRTGSGSREKGEEEGLC